MRARSLHATSLAGIGPVQLATGKQQQRHRVGLHHIRWGTPGMATAFADTELDRSERRYPQLHRAAGKGRREQRAHRAGRSSQLRAGEIGVRSGHRSDCAAQLLQIGC